MRPVHRLSQSSGSLNLESALVVALLVLVAAFTLFSLGDSIACLYEREAHMANRIGFWASMPGVEYETSAGAADGTVTWDTEGTEEDDTFTVLRMRPGDGADPEDHATWTDLGTYTAADRPVSGLDIRDGDYVVIAVDVERCGYGLIGPAWPDGGNPPDPGGSPEPTEATPGWYFGVFEVVDDLASWDNRTNYIAAFDSDGEQLWTLPVEGAEGWWSPAAASEPTAFLYLSESAWDPDSSTEYTSGFYAYQDWRTAAGPGEPELVIPGRTLTLSDGSTITLNSQSVDASRDGLRLLFCNDAYDTVVEYGVADQSVETVAIPGGNLDSMGAAVYGLDGEIYAFTEDGTLFRLPRVGGGTAVEQVWTGAPAEAVLEGVDADGTAWLSHYDGNSVWSVAADGTLTEHIGTGLTYNPYHLAFSPEGTPVDIWSDTDWETPYNTLRSPVTGDVVRDPLYRNPEDDRDVYTISFAAVTGNGDLAGDPIVPPPPPPPANAWRYEILVNGVSVFHQDFVPADQDSVTLNPIVTSSTDFIRYGRVEDDTYVLPLIRATTHRTLNATGNSRSDYAEINSPGRVPGNASSMAVPWSNYYDIQEPSASLSYWQGIEPAGLPPIAKWAGSHRPIAGFWAKSIEPGDAGDANAHVTAIGRNGSELAKSLCISLPMSSQNEPDERLGASYATYRTTGGLGIEQGGELNPYRVMNVVYPMLPSATGWQIPDEMGGVSMADMSLQVAGLVWDDGAGSIPDSTLTYFNTDASYPTVAEGSRGLLVMDTNRDGTYDHANGDTVLSYATRSKRSTIEIRITGGTVHAQEARPVKWTELGAGSYHSVGIDEHGHLWGWGYNESGQAYPHDRTDKHFPTMISSAEWIDVAATGDGALAIRSDGTLWGWGDGIPGHSPTNGTGMTELMPGEGPWASVSGQYIYGLEEGFYAIKSDGTLWNIRLNPATLSLVSVQVMPGDTFLYAAAHHNGSGNSNFAIKTDGTLWTWGENHYGVLGLGTDHTTVPFVATPTQVMPGMTWKAVRPGGSHVAAIGSDGTLWYWGRLGFNVLPQTNNPVQIGTGNNWTDAVADRADGGLMALDSSGNVYAVGWVSYGTMLLGTWEGDSGSATFVDTGYDLAEFGNLGGYHRNGITSDGYGYGWGTNYYGGVGHGGTTDPNYPAFEPVLIGPVVPSP